MFKALFPALLLASSASLFATTSTSLSPCAAGTLAAYENSYPLAPSSGCSIGILDYSNFSYHALSNAPATSDIILTPSGQGFNFTQATGTPFIATAGETVQFEIDYYILIDPAPVVAGPATSLIRPPATSRYRRTSATIPFIFLRARATDRKSAPSTISRLVLPVLLTRFPLPSHSLIRPPALKQSASCSRSPDPRPSMALPPTAMSLESRRNQPPSFWSVCVWRRLV